MFPAEWQENAQRGDAARHRDQTGAGCRGLRKESRLAFLVVPVLFAARSENIVDSGSPRCEIDYAVDREAVRVFIVLELGLVGVQCCAGAAWAERGSAQGQRWYSTPMPARKISI